MHFGRSNFRGQTILYRSLTAAFNQSAAIFIVKEPAKMRVQLHAYVGNSKVMSAMGGSWRALSVKFMNGLIADDGVEMRNVASSHTLQATSKFFQVNACCTQPYLLHPRSFSADPLSHARTVCIPSSCPSSHMI